MRTGEAALLLRSPLASSAGDTTLQRFRLLVHHLSRDAVILYFRISIGEATALLFLLSNRHRHAVSPLEEGSQFLSHINTPSSTIYHIVIWKLTLNTNEAESYPPGLAVATGKRAINFQTCHRFGIPANSGTEEVMSS